MTTEQTAPNFTALLEQALVTPGTIGAAYRAFHGYSLGNQLLASFQCAAREIPIGPLASFNRWKELGRHVSKGQKAIELCMPITMKREGEAGEDVTFTRFIFRRNWFVLAQTEGADYQPVDLPAWDKASALIALDITETPFTHIDGNCQGFARERSIAINPVAGLPCKTTFHELAHVLLGHTAEGQMNDGERTPKDIRELEAEAVAMLCCAALELPGVEEARGYMQAWYTAGDTIPDTSARKILKTADAILKAGQPVAKE